MVCTIYFNTSLVFFFLSLFYFDKILRNKHSLIIVGLYLGGIQVLNKLTRRRKTITLTFNPFLGEFFFGKQVKLVNKKSGGNPVNFH